MQRLLMAIPERLIKQSLVHAVLVVKSGELPLANPLVVLREEFDGWAVLFDPDTGPKMLSLGKSADMLPKKRAIISEHLSMSSLQRG